MSAILIVDDEPVLAHQLSVALRSNGHEVLLAETAAAGLERAGTSQPDLVLLDLRLPDRSGLDLIPDLRALDPALMIVMMTAYGTDRDAIEAVRRGAADYLPKPLNLGELGLVIDRLLSERRRERELLHLRDCEGASSLPEAFFEGALGASLEDALRFFDRGVEAGRRPPLLLMGDAGTGRRDFARVIHSRLGEGPFLHVSCRQDPVRLAEQLCGVEADPRRGRASMPGLVEAAEGGTLLLEDISHLPAALQGTLLQVISESRLCRVDGDRARTINVQIMASSEVDLAELESSGRFLPELSQILRALQLDVPPLGKRPDDVVRAAGIFAERFGIAQDGLARHLAVDATGPLTAAAWPHNLPELRNLIERSVLVTPGEEVSAATIEALLRSEHAVHEVMRLPEGGIEFEALERDLIRQALGLSHGNRTRAATLLGMSRDTFRYRMSRLGVEVN